MRSPVHKWYFELLTAFFVIHDGACSELSPGHQITILEPANSIMNSD